MKRVLIIKLGYSETLEEGVSQDVSFGDIIRTTFILNFFKDYYVAWLTDKKALPLLENNKYINKIFLWGPGSRDKLKEKFFDVVINFEKLKEVYLLVDSLKYKKLFGFSSAILYDKQRHNLHHRKLFRLSQSIADRKRNKYCWQKILAEIIGERWSGQEYILGYQPKSKKIYDVGFNWTTSKRWTNKVWPKSHWYSLERMIRDQYSISWQKGLHNLYDYMEWVNSCRLLVTADTLGLHLALALRRRAIGLFGPTSSHEIHLYDRGVSLLPKLRHGCIPCFRTSCRRRDPCMKYILPLQVKDAIDEELKKIKYSKKL